MKSIAEQIAAAAQKAARKKADELRRKMPREVKVPISGEEEAKEQIQKALSSTLEKSLGFKLPNLEMAMPEFGPMGAGVAGAQKFSQLTAKPPAAFMQQQDGEGEQESPQRATISGGETFAEKEKKRKLQEAERRKKKAVRRASRRLRERFR